jgi:nucleoside-diphosphate kinase
MGPTKVYRAQFTAADSIRGRFGLSDTRNAVHGSDSSESAVREIGIFFPDFSVARWFHEEEAYFKTGTVKLCAREFVHDIVSSS